MIRFALAALLATAAPALAEPQGPAIPEGMVDNPCIGLPPTPPASLLDYRRKVYEPGRTEPVPMPPQADLDAYKPVKAEQAKRDWADLCHYRADNAAIVASGRSPAIVFMGDSITEGWAIAHPGFFAPGMVNRGISGQTTPQMLVRFQADVVALRPRLVHIMAGTNDVAGNTGATDAQAWRNNIIAMVTLAKAAKIGVILAAIPPAAAFPWKPALRPSPTIQALNLWLKDYARREGLTFVDYHAALAEPDGALKKALTFDGIHPNAAGYDAIEPLTRDAIRRASRRK